MSYRKRKISMVKMAVNRHTVFMDLKNFLKDKGIKIYHLSKQTNIPRSTLRDIVDGRTKLCDCRYDTLKKLSDFLEIPVEVIVEEGGMALYPYERKGKDRQLAKNNEAGHTGVCKNSSRDDYRAYIKMCGINIHLGNFQTLEEAIAARKKSRRYVKNMSN